MLTYKALRADLRQRLMEYVEATLRGQAVPFHQLGTGAVARLEEKLKDFTGMRYALLVPNATTGLLLLGLALRLHRTHFIATPYAWGSSLVWMYLGCRVSFADVEPETLTLDPGAVRNRITPRTRALLSVDMDGVPADDEALRRLADEYGLWYVADGAQSLGARRDGRPAGIRAHALVLSFTHRKTLDLGEGGAVLTDEADLYERLLFYGQHPLRQKRELGLDVVNECTLNARIHPLAALWGEAVFEEALARVRARQRRFHRLVRDLNASGLTVPVEFEARGIEPAYFRLTAAWREKPQPEGLVRSLRERGWEVRPGPPPGPLIYHQAAFRRLFGRRVEAAACPQAEGELDRRFVLQETRPCHRKGGNKPISREGGHHGSTGDGPAVPWSENEGHFVSRRPEPVHNGPELL